MAIVKVLFRSLRFKIAVALLVPATAWLGFVLYRLYLTAEMINNEIGLLNAQILELKAANQNIIDEMEYAGTADYREREAKEKFNLQKTGEKVIIINRKSGSVPQEKAENDNFAGGRKYFWQKWFDYFWDK